MDIVIGIDFDNTLVSYDDIICNTAIQQGLIPPDIGESKKDVRDRIRQLPGGENEWQRLQAIVYGTRMDEARLMDGVQEFFGCCKRYQVRAYIISHKTEFVMLDGMNINFRTVALAWMRRSRFFEEEGLGLSQQDVYFESTRREKVERIRNLRCTHFIDDLEETFLEDSFPMDVERILYAPYMFHSSLQGIRVMSRWKDIGEHLFDARS